VISAAHRAPGKLVLSGAYSVLWGAPAIVAAVDRYAVAYPGEPAEHIADEVQAAIDLAILERACRVDVSGLRAPTEGGGSRKLGLGSSAAIVVSTLAAFGVGGSDVGTPDARRKIFEAALRAHRHVQPDGSGVDVAASTFGGVLVCQLEKGQLSTRAHQWPAPLRAFACRTPASTKDMVARVHSFAKEQPKRHDEIIARASRAATRATVATTEAELLEALREQDAALRELGAAANVPIFTPELDELGRIAAAEGAFFGPSGAGGGDIGIRVGSAKMSQPFATALARLGVDPLDLAISATGVEPVDAR
jgi:phosphomevalonate kinase